MKNKQIIVGLIFTLFLFAGFINIPGNTENLRVFAKAYGYVKYFHPSDEAQEINWSKFASYGAKEIENCRTREQVVETLNRLFSPVAPSVRFIISKSKPDYNLKVITPNNRSACKLTFWQHQGVSTGMKMSGVYKSVRVNSGTPVGEKIFDDQPQFGTIITKNIGNDIYCQVPLVLYRNEKGTYPKADSASLRKLRVDLSRFDFDPEKLSLRTGNIINVWNVFQHFYPYFDVVDVNWDNELTKALSRCYTDKTPEDHLITLEKFTAPLKDGHIFVTCNSLAYAAPPIWWEWIENKLVITRNFKNNPDIHIGDIVTQIDGISSAKYFEEINSRISAGTKGWLNKQAERMSLLGARGSVLKVTINGKSIDIPRENNPYDSWLALKKDEKRYRQIDANIWYLNMDMIEMDTINKLMPALEKCKAIICDARGYPKGNHFFINHLMRTDDTTAAWMQIPRIVYPDREKIIGYFKANWISMMKATNPYLGNKKIIYIIDGGAISYAESCLGYIEGYKLATIVGQPTAGTNGNVNPFELPGGYTIRWTGMKVLKHNGNQHHGIGILPNVYVTKTIQGIKDGRDEFLDKAIEIAKQK
ncbi:MAG: S41 family peptidase [Bacteroidia bacterium]|nr:S41 family peptidase [Bacteroidia bacterium]